MSDFGVARKLDCVVVLVIVEDNSLLDSRQLGWKSKNEQKNKGTTGRRRDDDDQKIHFCDGGTYKKNVKKCPILMHFLIF